ncbi:MAG: 2-amino-4-hydroxy-6-hydroxymethyldihydropteridine diphosphokinase [Lachnospiraceae bacterium]|nr:2-amino-4-hydroxy-6-hydroxymethyldihydropteridine diphosphokinase [Lachnospiraceae bacterium]
MTDSITINELECFGYHGVLAEEKKLGQKFLITMELSVDTSLAGETDQCADTVDYSLVCTKVKHLVETEVYDLIETLAEQIAKLVLHTFSSVQAITVTVKKPWAPIMTSVDTVSVRITRGWHRIYLGVGSNIGDSKGTIEKAAHLLSLNKDIRNLRLTSLISTKPYGVKDQPDFVNGAIYLETLLEPKALLRVTSSIEKEMGRERKQHWGPRTLDLDILFYDDRISDDPLLLLPHPEIAKRDFVLTPLVELNPYLIHPVYHKQVVELLEELKKKESYERTL